MADCTARFSNWFQIISNVAIIVGLALIVYELDQSKKVANGQMIDAAASRQNHNADKWVFSQLLQAQWQFREEGGSQGIVPRLVGQPERGNTLVFAASNLYFQGFTARHFSPSSSPLKFCYLSARI